MKALVSALVLGVTSGGFVAGAATPAARMESVCRGMSAPERSASALTRPDDVRSVQEIKPVTPASEAESPAQRWGARLMLRAQPGVTAEWLQRIAECHLATLAAQGGGDARSPLDVKGASVVVRSVGDGFAVDVTAGDPASGKDILTRALALPAPAKSAVRP